MWGEAPETDAGRSPLLTVAALGVWCLVWEAVGRAGALSIVPPLSRVAASGLGVVTSAGLWDVEPGSRVTVAGVVTHRQRPMTAQGTTFLNLEDETGLINVVVSKGCWARFRRVAREAPSMTIR